MAINFEAGRLVHEIAVFEFKPKEEQIVRLIRLEEAGMLKRGQVWETWEQFVLAHEEQEAA